jgi:hypothetical protein
MARQSYELWLNRGMSIWLIIYVLHLGKYIHLEWRWGMQRQIHFLHSSVRLLNLEMLHGQKNRLLQLLRFLLCRFSI